MTIHVRPEIISHLKRDKKLAPIVEQCEIHLHKSPMNVFDDLLRSVISQQLSTSAAATIYARFVSSLNDSRPLHIQILDKSTDELRSVGLSFQKAGYIHNITNHFIDNHLIDYIWDHHTDDEIISELTKIKGVGKWTVEMILIFSLGREDVLPLDDLIVRNHMVSLYNVSSSGKQLIADLTEIAEAWRPYRSFASRYLWAAKDKGLIK